MGPNNVVGTPNVQNQPVAPSGADAVEQALASMPMESNPNTPPMGMTQKKSGKGMLYGMIIFAILAIGGISFGVWAMLDGNSKVANLEKQVTDLRAQNNKLLEQLAESGTADTDIDVDDGSTSSVNPEDYIYVGEWGLKIKKPENWRGSVREYSFYNGYPQATDTLEIRESSEKGAGVMVGVGGGSCDTQVAAQHNTCFMIDGMVVIVTELVGELVDSNSSTVSEDFLKHFYNSENYSTI